MRGELVKRSSSGRLSRSGSPWPHVVQVLGACLVTAALYLHHDLSKEFLMVVLSTAATGSGLAGIVTRKRKGGSDEQ